MTLESVLPAWVVYGPWLVGPLFGAVGALITAFMLGTTKVPPPEPWTERARVLLPIRTLAIGGRLFLFLGACVYVAVGSRDTASPLRDLFTVCAAFVGPMIPAIRFERQLVPGTGLRSMLSRWTMLSAIVPVVLGPIVITGVAPSMRWALAAGIGAFLSLWVLGLNHALAKVLGLARPAPANVRGAVERAAQKLNVKCREILELDWMAANALAFPITRTVVFTKPMATLMSDEELEAVAAHELGHLSEPWRIKAARPLSVIGLYVALAVFAAYGQFTVEKLLGLMVAVLVILVVLRRAARAGETHADGTAHDHGVVYGRALERLYAFNLVPAVLRRAGAHGHLYDRLVASGYTPSWPRPLPPVRAPVTWRLAYGCTLIVPLFLAFLPSEPFISVDAAELAVALGPTNGWAYERLAREEALQNRDDRAEVLYAAAVHADPSEAFFRAAHARALALIGRCDDARMEYVAAQGGAEEALAYAARAIAQCTTLPPK